MSRDYKNTLLMMKTDFSMRAKLTEKEPLLVKAWDENRIYEKALEKNKGHQTLCYMMDHHMQMVTFMSDMH